MLFLFVLVILVGLILFGLVFSRLSQIERELEELRTWREGVARPGVGRPVIAETSAPEPAPAAIVAPPPAPPEPPPIREVPVVRDLEPAPEPEISTSARRALLEETSLRRLSSHAGETEEAAPHVSARSAEELIGGIWLQNAGSILLLLGVFFLILWGYTTGRFGPGVIVGAGVVFGALIGWRGDRMARKVPAFGHALIGVGIGAAYISLYLGHFALGVLSPTATTVLLALTSIAGILIGQRYRVQAIAGLAVIGAFVPQIAAILTHSRGFVDQPPVLLLYLAAIDVVVFALAARSRWPALALLALLLTTGTWISAVSQPYGWPVTLGLAALFIGLGLAPVPRLARDQAPMGSVDASVIVLAPYLFAVAAWPFLSAAPRIPVGALLAAFALIEAAAAFFARRVSQREELWNVLVTAAAVFLTAALERLLGSTWTPMSWVVEGVVLTAIGVAFASGYLRLLGAYVTGLGLVFGSPALFAIGGEAAGPPLAASGPLILFTANSVRSLVVVIALFVGSRVMTQAREADARASLLVVAWAGLAELGMLLWLGVHAMRLAALFVPGSGIPGLPGGEAAMAARRSALMLAILAWVASLQAFVAIVRGLRARAPHVRALGYGVAIAALGAFACSGLVALSFWTWLPSDGAFIHPAGVFGAMMVLVFALGAAFARRERGRFEGWEHHLPELLTIGLAGATWLWLGTETAHAAHLLASGARAAEPVLAGAMIAFAWTLQAGFALVIGVRKDLLHRRAIGYAVGATAGIAFLFALASDVAGGAAYGTPTRNLSSVFLVATLVLGQIGSARFGRARSILRPAERHLPVALAAVVSGLTWAWLGAESGNVAGLLTPGATGPNPLLLLALAALAWTVQAAASLAFGLARGVAYRRTIGYVIALSAVIAFLAGLLVGSTTPVGAGEPPTRNLAAGLFVSTLALWLVGATLFARRRDRLEESEAQAPEALAFAFNGMLMLWTAQHLAFLAGFLGTVEARRAFAVLTSASWVVQAAILFGVGWRARSPFLRWLGLGLFGITLGKVALFDLAFVDVFWRFLIAIFFGAVLLAISYVYQRSRPDGRKDTLPS